MYGANFEEGECQCVGSIDPSSLLISRYQDRLLANLFQFMNEVSSTGELAVARKSGDGREALSPLMLHVKFVLA